MKRTAIYLRVSSDKQVQEGDSIAAQRQALTKYIDDRPDLVLAGEYIDDGIYDGMEPDEKRRFWRAIIKTIWFDEERNINVEFL